MTAIGSRTVTSDHANETENGIDTAESGCDVLIVGAGPYGLAAAARLRALGGLDVRVFGQPMSFWDSMPRGMVLRSTWDACYIGYAEGELTLDGYQAQCDEPIGKPVPLESFVSYGRWFQRSVVPDVDTRRVARVGREGTGFRVELEDGAEVRAGRVVVAAGIESFAWRPPAFRELGPELVSHAGDHRDLSGFAGADVIVIGGGQSALESAALLHESGANVEVIARAQTLVWLHGGSIQRRLGRFKRTFYAQTDVGPLGLSRLVALPRLFTSLPRSLQERLAHRAIRPAGARWLVDRLTDVPIHTGLNVTRAERAGERASLLLDDGSRREADHVLLGTGYRVDVAGYDFLAPELVGKIRRVGGYPLLGAGLESSVPGLHFLGAPAAWSYGPIMRFVSGSWYASTQLTEAVRKSAVAA